MSQTQVIDIDDDGSIRCYHGETVGMRTSHTIQHPNRYLYLLSSLPMYVSSYLASSLPAVKPEEQRTNVTSLVGIIHSRSLANTDVYSLVE
jgi:hypothetical protein